MTALTTHAQRSAALHMIRRTPYPVKAGASIWDGALVCLENGLAVPGSDTAGLEFVGVAYAGYDNADGADGVVDGHSSARYCEVDDNGPWSFVFQGTTPKPGDDAFLADDNTATVDATTANIKIGKVTEPDPDTNRPGWWFVDLERR